METSLAGRGAKEGEGKTSAALLTHGREELTASRIASRYRKGRTIDGPREMSGAEIQNENMKQDMVLRGHVVCQMTTYL